MKSGFQELSKRQNEWLVGGVLCGIFLLLGIAIAWIGWWIVAIVLLIMLFMWNWRWALVITLAFLWALLN